MHALQNIQKNNILEHKQRGINNILLHLYLVLLYTISYSTKNLFCSKITVF